MGVKMNYYMNSDGIPYMAEESEDRIATQAEVGAYVNNVLRLKRIEAIFEEIRLLEMDQARPLRDIKIAELMGQEVSIDDISALAEIVADIDDLREELVELSVEIEALKCQQDNS